MNIEYKDPWIITTESRIIFSTNNEAETEIADFKSSWQKQLLEIRDPTDRQRFSNEIESICQTLRFSYQTLLMTFSQKEALDHIKQSIQQGHLRLNLTLSNFRISKAAFQTTSFQFNERLASTSVDFSHFSSSLSVTKEHTLPTPKGQCKRAIFSKAMKAYEKVQSIYDLREIAGGKLKQNFEEGGFITGCASRISYVLEETGCKIPIIPGQTVSGERGEQYIYRLTTLIPFMEKSYGAPDYEWRKDSSPEPTYAEMETYFSGKRGIIIERWDSGSHTMCTGHAYLFDGENIPIIYNQSNVIFWELPQDEQD
jgi:Type VI secretion system (T6SS), amidase effector protein 4